MIPKKNDTEDFNATIWALGVDDAHCHPTDNMSDTLKIPKMRTRHLTIMATRANDQQLVASLARSQPRTIIPSFGWHPWFSHLLSFEPSLSKTQHYESVLQPSANVSKEFINNLPEPILITKFLDQTRAYLEEFSYALVGEVGLDRTFRIPNSSNGWRREDMDDPTEKRLSPYKVQAAHQKRVLQAQLRLAGELGRSVSVHGVGAHGALYEVFEELFKGYEKPVESRRSRIRGRYDFQGDHESSSSTSSEEEEEESESEDIEVGQDEMPRKINVEQRNNNNNDDNSNKEEQANPTKSISKPEPTPTPLPFPPRICLHSFSAPPEFLRTWLNPKIPAKIYFSFSTTINTRYGDKFSDMVKIVPEDRLLIESDLDRAGSDQEHYLEDAVRVVSEVKGWSLEETVKIVGRNYLEFTNLKDGNLESIDGGDKSKRTENLKMEKEGRIVGVTQKVATTRRKKVQGGSKKASLRLDDDDGDYEYDDEYQQEEF